MSTRTYEVGDSIYFRSDDVTKLWGKVTQVQYSYPSGQVCRYLVKVDNGPDPIKVDIHQVIDLQEVADRATAALERSARQDRAKAELLDYLLGVLSYYAERDGQIVYAETNSVMSKYEARKSVREIVDEYTAKREWVYQD